jgi:histidinol phosphatase-like enzyme
MAYQKYIILDRDGVINVDLFDYVTKSADFKFEDGSLEALSILSENNFKIIVATNQACISLGIASKDQIDNGQFSHETKSWRTRIGYCSYRSLSS